MSTNVTFDVYQCDVVAIVRLIIVGIENEPLRADWMIIGAQQLRRLGVLDRSADLPAHVLLRRFVGLFVDQQICKRIQEADAAALRPFCLGGVSPLLLG